jgi:hypothetical protein
MAGPGEGGGGKGSRGLGCSIKVGWARSRDRRDTLFRVSFQVLLGFSWNRAAGELVAG